MFVHSSNICFWSSFYSTSLRIFVKWLSFLLLSIILTWSNQLNRFILTNKLYLNLQTLILILYYMAFSVLIYFNSPPKNLLKTFLSKATSSTLIQCPKFFSICCHLSCYCLIICYLPALNTDQDFTSENRAWHALFLFVIFFNLWS
jgi:hypothetical protein